MSDDAAPETETEFDRFLLEQYQTAPLRFLDYCTRSLGL